MFPLFFDGGFVRRRRRRVIRDDRGTYFLPT